MAKQQKSFAEKVAKASADFSRHCKKCNESVTTVKMVVTERSPKTGAYRFKEKFVGICKCNEKDLL
jgi:hypothetical protein